MSVPPLVSIVMAYPRWPLSLLTTLASGALCAAAFYMALRWEMRRERFDSLIRPRRPIPREPERRPSSEFERV